MKPNSRILLSKNWKVNGEKVIKLFIGEICLIFFRSVQYKTENPDFVWTTNQIIAQLTFQLHFVSDLENLKYPRHKQYSTK